MLIATHQFKQPLYHKVLLEKMLLIKYQISRDEIFWEQIPDLKCIHRMTNG